MAVSSAVNPGETIWGQGFTLIAPPTEEPVSLSEARDWCFVEGVDATADRLLTGNIVMARALAEEFTNRKFVTQTWRLHLDDFPTGSLLLPYSPLQAIDAVRYYTAGVLTTLASTEYSWDETREPAWLLFAEDEGDWPTVDDVYNAVVVDIIVGYGSAPQVPQPIKTAILLAVKHFYDKREAASLPDAFYQLLYPYRVHI